MANMKEFAQYNSQHARNLDTQINSVLGNKTSIRSALVEAGNFYGGEQLKPHNILGLQIGAHVVKQLELLGIPTTRAILIDNYHHGSYGSKITDVHPIIAVANASGFTPDRVIFEEMYLFPAEELVNHLVTKRRAKKNGEGKVRYKGHVLVEENGRVACAAFEVPIHMDKQTQHPDGVLVTVLEEKYRSQQHLVQALLHEVERKIPTLLVYFNDQGETSIESYNLEILDF